MNILIEIMFRNVQELLIIKSGYYWTAIIDLIFKGGLYRGLEGINGEG